MQAIVQDECNDSANDPIILEPSYRPSKSEEYMCDKHLGFFKQRLQQWKRDLKRELIEAEEQINSTSLIDPDLSDRASAETDVALGLKRQSRILKLITQIDAALQRIENRSYGYCEETGEEIGLERLCVRPIAKMCIEAQEAHEKFEKRHNKVISPHKKDEDEDDETIK